MITREVGLLSVGEAFHVVRYTDSEELKAKVLLALRVKKTRLNHALAIYRKDLGRVAHGIKPVLPLDDDRTAHCVAVSNLVHYMEVELGV